MSDRQKPSGGWRTALAGREWTVAFAVYSALFALLILTRTFSDETRSIIANAWYLPIGAISAILAWQVARHSGQSSRHRLAWRLIAFGLVTALISDALWLYVENIRGEDPSDTLLANVGYLLFYPALLASLLMLSESLRSRHDALKFGLDVTTVVVAGGMAVWHFVIAPTIASNDATPLSFFLAVAYPIGDILLLIGLATIFLRYPTGARRWPITFLAIAVASMMVGDLVLAHVSLVSSFEAGNVQDLPYLVQYMLFAIGLAEERRRLHRATAEDESHAAGSFPALPYLAVVGGYLVLIDVDWKNVRGEGAPILVGAAVLSILVVRQMLALRENVRLKSQAHYDPVTKLANRVLFERHVSEALGRHQGGTVAVLYIDLDKFKEINDTYGHAVGDALLKAAAQRLVSHIRPVDTAARLGGDEFAVLLEDPDNRIDPQAIGHRIADAFHEPLSVNGDYLAVTASVGVAIATPGQSSKDLQHEADLAMYLAKRSGRGRAASLERESETPALAPPVQVAAPKVSTRIH